MRVLVPGLIALLLGGCSSLKGATIKTPLAKVERGAFSRDGADFFTEDLDPGNTPAIARERLERYASFHDVSNILTTPTAMVAVIDNGKKIAAYVGGPSPVWVMVDCPKHDWHDAVKLSPDAVVRSLAEVKTPESIVPADGHVLLDNGTKWKLPANWYLYEEALGGSPCKTTGILRHKGAKVYCSIEYTRSLVKSGRLKYGHMKVKESKGNFRHLIDEKTNEISGFAIASKSGFALIYEKNTTDEQKREIEKLARFFAAQPS